MAALMIYGATGYTGRLVCEQAQSVGLGFIVAGRSKEKLAALATELKVGYRAFDLSNGSPESHLSNIKVLLNCAGPFVNTASVLMQACLRSKAHYLDVSAELACYLEARSLSETAERAGVMLLPGCGGSVAMLGCLASQAMQKVRKPIMISIALHVSGSMSRGSAISAAESGITGALRVKDGELVQQASTDPVDFDFGDGRGPVSCFPVTLPDLITLYKSTGSSNIQTFVNVSANAFPSGDVKMLPDGPNPDERAESLYDAAVEIEDSEQGRASAVMHTINGYDFTAIASVEAAWRVLAGEVTAGWQTPVDLFGPEFFANTVPGTVINGL